MTNLSNLYVEKVLSEHPISTWVFSEDLGYISLISENNRRLYNAGEWSLIHSTSALESSPPIGVPFPNSYTSKIIGSVPSSSTMAISETSIFSLDQTQINQTLGNFTFGFYIYINNPYTTSISLGYQYYNTGTLSTVQVLQDIVVSSSDVNSWKFISGTFDLPTTSYTTVKLITIMNVKSGGGTGNYNFYINGLSVGQWSEEFNIRSLGVSPSSILSNIALPNTLKSISAKQYSTYQNDAYYLSNSSTMFAKNFGIPLVYGSSNVTKLYENKINNVNYPSLIIPGNGFLNARGKYNTYTAEMWIRLNTDTNVPRKVFGPITGSDGLYADGGFLTMVIGQNLSSHYVGEWNRPMLIHIRFIKNNISVLLNGEEIISISLNENELSFPSEFDIDDKSQDWLGFYSYEDVHPFEIDSFAIYSYSVPVEVAKRRWVWGQGVLPPESTNYSAGSSTAFNDYSFANYSSNYNYPDFANWNQGFYSNIDTTTTVLKTPDYKLPIFYLDDLDYDTWINDIHEGQEDNSEKYFTFRPNAEWDNKNCYILFNNLNVLKENLKMFYAVFESDGTSSNEILFKIVNKITQDFFTCSINGTDVKYSINISGNEIEIETLSITENEDFTCGFDISKISNLAEYKFNGINNFFSIPSNLSLYVGGDGSSTYTGLIHKIGFNSEYNSKKISPSFINNYGLFDISSSIGNLMINHVANYTLVLLYKYDILFTDIAVSSYWEDYIPLSYFGKTTKDYKGKEYYDLDSLQINVDYPEPMEKSSIESTGSWTYQDLLIRYQTIQDTPYLQSYDSLDNNLYNGWDNYQDMSEDSQKYYVYNTSNNSVKTYISFQKIINGANKNLVDFNYIESMPISGVVEPDSSHVFWENTVFEVIDGAIVYAPKQDDNFDWDLNFNEYAIVTHIDFSSDGILHNPIKLKDLQFASKVLERNDFSKIGTKFGTVLYPYRKTGVYYDFKGHNPISTYKGSTPHLYLNNNTGWQFRGSFSPLVEKGLSMPVNSQYGLNVKISSIQVWLKFSETVFPTTGVLILSIDHKDSIYDFYLIADASTQRGNIYGIDRTTGNRLNNITYSVNGNLVNDPYIVNENWSVLGIGFEDLLNFNQYSGSLNITGPIMFNNLSYHLANDLQQNQQIQSRVWSEAKASSATWTTWKTPVDFNADGDYLDSGEYDGTWKNLDIIGTSAIYNISPDTIYNHYVGVDRIIVDDAVDGILVNPEKIKIYSGPNWAISLKTPA